MHHSRHQTLHAISIISAAFLAWALPVSALLDAAVGIGLAAFVNGG